jgi:hypothetical protein
MVGLSALPGLKSATESDEKRTKVPLRYPGMA